MVGFHLLLGEERRHIQESSEKYLSIYDLLSIISFLFKHFINFVDLFQILGTFYMVGSTQVTHDISFTLMIKARRSGADTALCLGLRIFCDARVF